MEVFGGGGAGIVFAEIEAMTTAPPSLRERLASLKSDLEAQFRSVQTAVDTAVDALFEKDSEKAQSVIDGDEEIDALDVMIERGAVSILQEAAKQANSDLDESDIRLLLTIVKVNNEVERIADLAVNIAEHVANIGSLDERPPTTFRVMGNSIIGILENTSRAFVRMDGDSARIVLSSDDTTDAFKIAILREVEVGLAAGRHSVDFAFALNTIASSMRRIGDHCTNIAEQIIYVSTGKIVRHQGNKWTDPVEPA